MGWSMRGIIGGGSPKFYYMTSKNRYFPVMKAIML